jgi:hypothetical protein
MSLQKIGKMRLRSLNVAVARIQFSYLDNDGETKVSRQGKDITLGFSATEDPGDLGVPDGSTVHLNVWAPFDVDHEAKEAFEYEKGNSTIASYDVSGTALSKDIRLVDVA